MSNEGREISNLINTEKNRDRLSRNEPTKAWWTLAQKTKAIWHDRKYKKWQQTCEDKGGSHPSAPRCLEGRLGKRRLCGKCLRIPCPDLQFPSSQSSSLGWWLSVSPPWSLPFLFKTHKGNFFTRRSQICILKQVTTQGQRKILIKRKFNPVMMWMFGDVIRQKGQLLMKTTHWERTLQCVLTAILWIK